MWTKLFLIFSVAAIPYTSVDRGMVRPIVKTGVIGEGLGNRAEATKGQIKAPLLGILLNSVAWIGGMLIIGYKTERD
jgi:hypothetical protein